MKSACLINFFLFLLLVCGLCKKIQAQDSLTFSSVENKTYHYYLNGQWDSLVSTGKAGLHQDIDYFYLRVRMGLAYFYKGNYCRAIHHFKKALSFNSDDSTSTEYLYYSFKDNNRPLYQHEVAKKYRIAERRHMAYNYPLHNNSFIPEMGYQIDQAFKVSNNQLLGPPPNNFYGEIDHPVSFIYFGMKYRHYFGGLALNVSYDHLDSEREKKSVYPGGAFADKYNVAEHHFYVNTEISLNNKLTIIPALHYQLSKYSKFEAVWNISESIYNFPMTDYTYNNFVASLGLYKDVDIVSLGLTASYTSLYKKNIFQEALMITVFPFGNTNRYSTTTLAFLQFPAKGNNGAEQVSQSQQNTNNSDKNHPIIEEVIGGKIANKIWLEGQFAYNGLRGYNKDNAGIIFNSPEQIKYLLGITGIYEITNSLELTLGYELMQKDITGIHYIGINSYVTDHYLYKSHTIYGGLKWKL